MKSDALKRLKINPDELGSWNYEIRLNNAKIASGKLARDMRPVLEWIDKNCHACPTTHGPWRKALWWMGWLFEGNHDLNEPETDWGSSEKGYLEPLNGPP